MTTAKLPITGILKYKGNNIYIVPEFFDSIISIEMCGISVTSFEIINNRHIKMCELPHDCECARVVYTKADPVCETCSC